MIHITHIEVDYSDLKESLENIKSDKEFMTEVQQEFADVVNPYVPYDTGNLSEDITVDETGVTYNAEYADKQYYGEEFHHNTEHHPLATARWDEVAMQTQQEELESRIVDLLEKRFKDGQK